MTSAVRRLDVIAPGPRTLAQDAGRAGWRGVGAPVSGAADGVLWRLAQAVAGGPEGACALEFALLGPTLRAAGGPARVALGGAEGRVTGADGEARRAPALRSFTLAEGETLAVGPVSGGAVGYLAVEGGFDLPVVMGARATDLRAGFGGFRGRALAPGDRLPLAGPPPQGPERALAAPPPPPEGPLRVIMGPQTDHFTVEALETFLAAEWRVSDDVDRMGARLQGPRLRHSDKGADMISEGLAIGAVQVPGAGQPIVLGVDSHTIGGYPKIAVVVTADIPRLGRLTPGRTVRFAAVTLAEAAAARRAAAADLARAIAAIRPVAGGAAPVDLAALASANLVSGVVSAREEQS
ncbi:biotin-dependent carboxyltransferase family protein [Rubrimonas cliftonensis]|uniref:Biotin-dependent carboxylase uncharacterized domain-containing protein n=1 Tax=Rubrimonas cliftonensis TaxID=89524 RepID=A0A1H4D6J9_9RHOB|nr:biotin-dependent carboxyltransferase family protein [Rubrimonas cliftonensis]SEA68344.1 biotin-dependent carboxylase uncharacterized domain-containing protein [Rubrimonas cliftonensis]